MSLWITRTLITAILINSIGCDVDSPKLKESKTLIYRSKKPNIVLLLTDDQDVELGSLNFMPKTIKSIRSRGAEFRHAYVTTPMCCPSRSSLLTGMYVHNHQVFTNKDNCSSPHWQAHYEPKSFATYLSNAGYRTGYFGKYLNKYNGSYIPPGWREWGGLVMNSKYYNYSINMNGQTIRHGFNYEKDYYTDLITRDSITFLRNSKKQFPNKPIMLTMAFPAPHGPEDSAPQFSDQFFNVTTHHTPSYDFAPNPDKQWILKVTEKMKPVHREFTDLLMTKRLQTLQSVDQAVERIVEELSDLSELQNTYIIYTSDHGYHLGQFGLIKGKSFPFEFDVRVPFLISGPDIEPGATIKEIVLNIDLAPTFLDIAGVSIPNHMDGRSILPLLSSHRKKKSKWPDTFLIESSGRRETVHEDIKQQQKSLLQFSVPHNTNTGYQDLKDTSNVLSIQIHTENNFHEKELTVSSSEGDARIENMKKNIINHDNLHYMGNITTEDISMSNITLLLNRMKTSKTAYKCLTDYKKLPCRKGQKWFCHMEHGRWRKFKCNLSQGEGNNKEQRCVCFTTNGLVFRPHLMSNSVLRKSEYKSSKYCYCDTGKEISNETQGLHHIKEIKRKQKKREEICHHERMTCFEHNNDHWRTDPKWNSGSFCFCMNANNNTYSCIRTINSLHNFLYCEFTTGLSSFYNLRIDPFELQNRYDQLNQKDKLYLHKILKHMISCQGKSCTMHLDNYQLSYF